MSYTPLNDVEDELVDLNTKGLTNNELLVDIKSLLSLILIETRVNNQIMREAFEVDTQENDLRKDNFN